MIIAIDGPAGAGKSSLAKALAKKLGYTYIDTGAMYRAVAYKINQLGISPDELDKILEVLKNTSIELIQSEDGVKVILDGRDVSNEIRTEEIGKISSKIAVYSEVRRFLVNLQREMGLKYKNVVIEGRDTGTVIFPDADIKLFITASPEVRAERRYKQLKEKGFDVDYNQILKDVIERDKIDTSRKDSPLKPAEDSIIIDTSNMSFEEVLNKVLEIIEKKSS
jgi:cytidylate kinase